MDKMYIKDLEVYGHHGVYAQEKELGQKFLISLELFLDLKEAGKTDNLNKTVHYGELCIAVEKEFNREKYDLIERAGEVVAEYVLLKYPMVERVKVLIKKPWAPIGKPLEYAAIEIDRKWHRAYIGMGSNLGDKEKNLRDAMEYISNAKENKIIEISSFYATKPVGYKEQDDFMNCVIEIKTLHDPKELITALLQIEQKLKRERVIRWGPRTIDLDVLLYDDCITSCREAIIPHPRMQERLFVLKPLCELAPYALHPILNKRMIELMEVFSKEENLEVQKI